MNIANRFGLEVNQEHIYGNYKQKGVQEARSFLMYKYRQTGRLLSKRSTFICACHSMRRSVMNILQL